MNRGSKSPKVMPETSVRLSQQKQRDIGPRQGRSVMMAGGRGEREEGREAETFKEREARRDLKTDIHRLKRREASPLGNLK